MIEFKDVTFVFDNNTNFKNMIFHKLNVKIDQNKINLFFGYSGDGKTTFVKLLTKIISPQSGEIFLDGELLKKIKQEDIAKKIRSLPQSNHHFFTYDTIIKELDYRYKAVHNKYADEEKLKDLIKYFKLDLKTFDTVDQLSNGEKKIVSIIISLLLEPEYLILDEPFVGLDSVVSKLLVNYLKNNFPGKVILISHNVTHIYREIDNVYFVNGYTVKKIELSQAFETGILVKPTDVQIAEKLNLPMNSSKVDIINEIRSKVGK